MAFIKKTWLARLGVGLNRFRMNNSADVVLESNPVSITQQGDQLSADNMNNLETRIGNAFDEMAGNLATIEVSPSQHNWTVGSQIVYNGILYKVTSAISTNDNLVVGTNIEPYPVSSAISDISDKKGTYNAFGQIMWWGWGHRAVGVSCGFNITEYTITINSVTIGGKNEADTTITSGFSIHTKFDTGFVFTNNSGFPWCDDATALLVEVTYTLS